MKHKLLVLGTIFLMAGCSNQPASIDSQVDELYAQMSMEERVAHLCNRCWSGPHHCHLPM